MASTTNSDYDYDEWLDSAYFPPAIKMKAAVTSRYFLPGLMLATLASCTSDPPPPPDKLTCPDLFRGVLATKLQGSEHTIGYDPFVIFTEVGLSTTHETNARNNCIELNSAAEQAGNEPVCRRDPDCEYSDDSCLGFCDVLEAAILNPHATYPASLALAFKQIELGKPNKAKNTLEPHLGEENEPETYTYIIAAFKDAVDFLDDLLVVIDDEIGETSE